MNDTLTKISGMFSSALKNLSSKKVESVLGIDIGSSSIKVVQLKKHGGKAVLETYGALSLGPYGQMEIGQVTNLSVEAISQALVDIIKESNVTATKVAVAIPSSASLISIITIPGEIAKDKLAEVIPTEARKYIPVPITEVTLDWWVIPEQIESLENTNEKSAVATTAKPQSDVLIVAIHNDVLSKYRSILEKTNLNSDFFEIEIFSSIRSTFSHDLASVLIMDFGASKTKLSIVEYGIVRSFHIVNRGCQDITKNISQSLSISFSEAEALKRKVGLDLSLNKEAAEIVQLSVEYILSETNNVVLSYEKKYNKSISKVILSGGGALTRGLLPRVIENFRAEVIYGNPFDKTEAPAFLEPVLATSGPEFAVALGLALRELS